MSVDKPEIIKFDDVEEQQISFMHNEFVATWFVKKMRIKENAKKRNGKTLVTFPESLQIGDIFKIKKHYHEFFVARWDSYHPWGGQTYEIKRVDGNRISQFDLDALKKKTWIQVTGYLNKNKCSN